MGIGRRKVSGDCLFSYMQMIWFCVVKSEEEGLRVVVGCFAEVCRRGLRVNADNS